MLEEYPRSSLDGMDPAQKAFAIARKIPPMVNALQ
jgi:hypothetical protein